MTLSSEFDTLNVAEGAAIQATTTDEAAKAAAKKEAKKEKAKLFHMAYEKRLAADPNYFANAGSAKNNLKVMRVLGFGEGGGLIADKSQPKVMNSKGVMEYPRVAVPANVGYVIQNMGKDPIVYTTEEFTLVDGQWVGNMVQKTLAPKAKVEITKKCLTMLTARVEFSFMLANGTMVQSSSSKGLNDVNAVLESYHFKFADNEGSINNDKTKDQIGVKVGDTWKVKPEYQATFGFLENTKTKAPRAAAAKTGVGVYTLAANYVASLIEEA